MGGSKVSEAFSGLSTAAVFDASLRLKRPFRVAPPALRSLVQGCRIAGRALPVRHYGSVDIFLEAMSNAEPGDVLVIDNGGRMNEACIGDLTVLETKASGLSGLVVWGCHRDSAELLRIGFPVFSLGAHPAGPQRLDPREPEALSEARFGGFSSTRDDVVFADDDGVLFVSVKDVDELLPAALAISKSERAQAEGVRGGRKLRDQLQFDVYMGRRASDPSYTFRRHLRTIGGAIEE